MRDLLYLSETKMRALVPQLPGQLRRRLGFEAGLNAGFASAKATLPSASPPSSIALLDAVIEMIERDKRSRWRTDSDLRAGDWIQFEEEFRYGDAATAPYLERIEDYAGADDVAAARHALSGLVYFAATGGEAPLVLVGSSVHVLDRWQSVDAYARPAGAFYMQAVIAYARKLADLADEAAATEFIPPGLDGDDPAVRDLYGWELLPAPSPRSLWYALDWLCSVETRDDRGNGWAPGPVWLGGHARVLAVDSRSPAEPPGVLATPLYVEYASEA